MRVIRPHLSKGHLSNGVWLVGVVLLLNAREAFANGFTAGLGFVPGLAPIDFIYGPLITVAIAILERPFFARAGFTPWALIHSLRANFISYLLGIPIAVAYIATVAFLSPLTSENSDYLLLGLPVVLILATIVIEKGVALRFFARGKPLQTWWIVLGNLFSNLVLLALAAIVHVVTVLIEHHFLWEHLVQRLQPFMVVAYLVLLAGAILLAAGVPLWKILPEALQRSLSIPQVGGQPENAPDQLTAPTVLAAKRDPLAYPP